MSEPNVLREVAAGLDNAPELSEADYEAMEAAERKRVIEQLQAEEQRLWLEFNSMNDDDGACEAWEIRRARANVAWSAAYTKLREHWDKWGDL